MQFALEEPLVSPILADFDEANIGKWAGEECFDPLTRGGRERVKAAVHHQPPGALEANPMILMTSTTLKIFQR